LLDSLNWRRTLSLRALLARGKAGAVLASRPGMRCLALCLVACALALTASAAPNTVNSSQQGSLLVFGDIRMDQAGGDSCGDSEICPEAAVGRWETLIRIQNDGGSDVQVKCYWMDGYKNRVDFEFPITRNQSVWFDARTGRGSVQVNPFPAGSANGFTAGNRHPFLGGDVQASWLGWNATVQPGFGAYERGMLMCWAVDQAGQTQIKWNHLSATATLYNTVAGAYEVSAYAMYAPTGADLQPIGTPGVLNLNGLEFDACPLYLIGQFSPPSPGNFPAGAIPYYSNRLAVVSCTQYLNQDWHPVWTKLQFDVWNQEEVKFTGAYECADSWHETAFLPGVVGQATATGVPNTIGPGFIDGIDAAGQNFLFDTLGTYAARYRVQGVKSTQCDRAKPASGSGADVAAVTTEAVGILGVQSSEELSSIFGTPLAGAGKMSGRIFWDPASTIPEGGGR